MGRHMDLGFIFQTCLHTRALNPNLFNLFSLNSRNRLNTNTERERVFKRGDMWRRERNEIIFSISYLQFQRTVREVSNSKTKPVFMNCLNDNRKKKIKKTFQSGKKIKTLFLPIKPSFPISSKFTLFANLRIQTTLWSLFYKARMKMGLLFTEWYFFFLI